MRQRGVHFVDPAGSGVGEGVEGGYVRFDIEDGSAVDEVARAEDQAALFDSEEANGGDADRVWAIGGPGGEDAATLGRAAWGENQGAPVGVAMKPPDQPDAVEPGEIGQGLFVIVAGEEFEDAAFLIGLGRLMARLELELFGGADTRLPVPF